MGVGPDRDPHRRRDRVPGVDPGPELPPLRGLRPGRHHDADLAAAALCVAIAVRGGDVAGVVFHTDQGGEDEYNTVRQHSTDGMLAPSSSNANGPRQRWSPQEDRSASWSRAAEVTAPPLHAQGSLMRSLRDGLRPPLTRSPLRHLADHYQGQAGHGPAPEARGARVRSRHHIN